MSLPLALTMGEPAGIGGEITLKAWLQRHSAHLPPFVVIDDPGRLAGLARALGLPVTVKPLEKLEEAASVFADALPVLPLAVPQAVIPGRPDAANAAAVITSIEIGVALASEHRASALVTNPIQKEVLYAAGFHHPGHTEFLAALADGADVAMMLATTDLRVVPVTIHLSLREALAALTPERIITAGRIAAAGLQRDFGIAQPRLAVAAVNPHAGEKGTLGREEIEIIAPAVAALRAQGLDAEGPAPADTLFHAEARRRYDAVLCMYHDQALIPLKTIDFARGVNVTLGLPFIRTSPDHGTALGIAGRGTADPSSLIAALQLAREMAARRAPTRATA